MPPPSSTSHLPSTHPATKQRPKSPNRVLAEAEAQWLFTKEELANTPSIQDGMSVAEERDRRVKGINFIYQVGVMLKLPQLSLSTASIFFQRFLMRASLQKERNGIPKLHHYQAAATALFLATKVEESCRKMRELVLAFCRVAQKNPNLIVDEQSKDFWRWRDLILHNEDHMLEVLCFDLTVESPHRQLFEMLKYYGIEHNKPVRNCAWAFVTDSNNTQLCLLYSSRVITVASLYAACKFCNVSLPDDSKGRPWWEGQHVRLKDIRSAVDFMLASYDHSENKINGIATTGGSDGNGSMYAGLLTPGTDGTSDWDKTRALRDDVVKSTSASPYPPNGSDRRHSNASSVGTKRGREVDPGDHTSNDLAVKDDKENKRPRLDDQEASQAEEKRSNCRVNSVMESTVLEVQREEAERVDFENKQAEATQPEFKQATNGTNHPASAAPTDGDASEEGELDE